MGDLFTAHNDMMEVYSSQEQEMIWIKGKIADLKDRSRRNNLKFRGVPESMPPKELMTYIQRIMTVPQRPLMTTSLIARTETKCFAAHGTKCTSTFFHIKEEVLRAHRRSPNLPADFANITIYADPSTATLQIRRNLAPVTQILQKHNVL